MKLRKVGVVFSFVLILILMVSIISAFSLTGMAVSVDKDGWDVKTLEEQKVIPTNTSDNNSGETKLDSKNEIENTIEKDNSLNVNVKGSDVEISLNDKGIVEIDDGTNVETKETIRVEENTLSIEKEDGSLVNIKIMPADAIKSFIASGEATSESKVELKIEEGVPYYSIETLQKARFLGIIPYKKTVQVNINAQTGQRLGGEEEGEGFFSKLFGGLFGGDKVNPVRLVSPESLTSEEQAHADEVLAMIEELEIEDDFTELPIPEDIELEDDFVEPVFDNVYNPEINMGSERDCVYLTQSMIDSSSGADIELDYDGGCIAMENNLSMGNKTLIVRGGFTFDCQDNYLIGNGEYGIISYNTTNVQNCVVRNRNIYGFLLYGYSSVTTSTANDNTDYGFYLQDFSTVTDSTANNNNYGFYLQHSSTVTDSTANNNDRGFILHDSSTVTSSTANNNNNYGFVLHDSSTVTDSTANDNNKGFYVLDSSTVTSSTANNNYFYGFVLHHSSTVTDSTANNNNDQGFYLYDSSTVTSSTASNNDRGFILHDSSTVTNSTARDNDYGFVLHDSSTVISSTANNNNNYGFYVRDSSTVTSSTANNNNNYGFYVRDSSTVTSSTANNNNNMGFYVRDSSTAENIISLDNGVDGIFVNSASSLLTGIASCGNSGGDIFSNWGDIEGTFYADNVGGVWNGNLDVLPCSEYDYVPEDSCMLGDVTGDSSVDVLDIVRIVSYIQGNIELSSEELCAADYNSDGGIDVLDIVAMVDFVSGNGVPPEAISDSLQEAGYNVPANSLKDSNAWNIAFRNYVGRNN